MTIRYGALGDVQRLDLSSGRWSDLPPLKPVGHCQINIAIIVVILQHVDDQVRAQHGCALVELRGESGMLVVGGDSGGTRLNDVRLEDKYNYKYKNYYK